MTPNNKDKNRFPDSRAVIDAAIELAIEDELEREGVTAADLHTAFEAMSVMRPAIAELRRQLIPASGAIQRATPINSELSAMDRGEMLARIEQLRQQGHVRYAFQELKGLSDDDLRQMLTILMETTQG